MTPSSLTRLALAGALAGLTGCNSTTNTPSNPNIESAKTLAEFEAACAEEGGTYSTAAQNDCAGYSFLNGTVVYHGCQGHAPAEHSANCMLEV